MTQSTCKHREAVGAMSIRGSFLDFYDSVLVVVLHIGNLCDCSLSRPVASDQLFVHPSCLGGSLCLCCFCGSVFRSDALQVVLDCSFSGGRSSHRRLLLSPALCQRPSGESGSVLLLPLDCFESAALCVLLREAACNEATSAALSHRPLKGHGVDQRPRIAAFFQLLMHVLNEAQMCQS